MSKSDQVQQGKDDGASSAIDVPIKGETGNDLGFTIKLAPDGDTLADRIEGWSTLVVHGEPYPFSKGRASALLARFPYMAAQLERAGKKDETK